MQNYIRKALAGESVTFQSERLIGEERARETIAIQLRRADGIPRTEFRTQTGYQLGALVGGAIERYAALGLLHNEKERVYLTRRGKCVADAVVRELIV